MLRLFLLSWLFFALASCHSFSRSILEGRGVYQDIFNRSNELYSVELRYPKTGNISLDELLAAEIRKLYDRFREDINADSLESLNQGKFYRYSISFDVSRSKDLGIISFIFYELVEEPQSNSRTLRVYTYSYSLYDDEQVEFRDVVSQPLDVYQAIVDNVAEQLEQRLAPGESYNKAALFADYEHLKYITFANSGLQVSFAPGTLMDASQGVINILVPWEKAIAQRPWAEGLNPRYSKYIPASKRSER